MTRKPSSTAVLEFVRSADVGLDEPADRGLTRRTDGARRPTRNNGCRRPLDLARRGRSPDRGRDSAPAGRCRCGGLCRPSRARSVATSTSPHIRDPPRRSTSTARRGRRPTNSSWPTTVLEVRVWVGREVEAPARSARTSAPAPRREHGRRGRAATWPIGSRTSPSLPTQPEGRSTRRSRGFAEPERRVVGFEHCGRHEEHAQHRLPELPPTTPRTTSSRRPRRRCPRPTG